ncbi:MAG TPA: gamma-glutamyl-gamma-aminobutyrate hydrolase family protein [Streptosporangiaceae bacterium]
MSAGQPARPVIGLTAYAESARWAAWHAPATLLPLAYAEQVAAAGGIPVLLPPVAGIAAAAGRLDGLLLTGGGDIDPAVYGAEPHPRTARVSQQRDRAELELLAAGLAGGLPVLGICRGLQVLNVARGGTLHQHLGDLPDPAGHAAHSPAPGTYGSHPVRIAPGSKLAEILGCAEEPAPNGQGPGGPGAGGPGAPWRAVPTAHHQAIDRLGDGLTATAWATDDVIEAVELGPVTPGQHSFVLAVQWHPEVGGDPGLFQALVAAASGRSLLSGTRPRSA